MAFAHLHVHSEYSPIDSLAKVKDLVAMAAADCNPALAISDHGTLAGIWKLGQYAAIHGLKAIPAIEAYLSIGDRFEHNALTVPDDDADPDVEGGKGTKRKVYEHLTLLATTRTGWRNLVQMTNASHDSFWYKPRLDYGLLEQHGEGLIVLTGCLGGPVAGPLSRGDRAQAVTNLRRLVRCVGRENVYVEVMDHGIEAQLRIMDDLRSVAAEVGVPLVATNDSHYIHANQRDAHEAWLAVGTHAVLSSTERFAFHGHGHHLRTEAEMRALQGGAAWWQEACDNTVTIAARVADDVLPASKLRLPKFPVPDGFADSGTYLKHLVREGAFERYGSDPARPEGRFLPPAVNAQLKFEFTVVDNAGLPDYFLIVHDIIEWARSDRGLPTAVFPNGEPGKKTPIRVGPGRGSAAGSTISYALKIVGVEPMANGLLFERFLNPQRTGMPDIDVDFEQGRRAEVLRYIAARFGRDRVARIGTFGIDQSRAAIKDGARVLELTGVGNKLSSLVPIGGNGKPYAFKALDDQADKAGEAFRAAVRDSGDPADHILTLARAFEGVTKQEGIHACGTLIADEPMAPLVPLRRDLSKGATDEDLLITVWDGKDVDDYGLLKMDVLGLRNLDVISAAVRFIEQTTGELIEPDDLMPNNPDDIERDTKAWDLISSGRTAGVFQLESAGMTKLAEQVAPNSLADLTALVALFRPGPLAAGMHEHYAARKNGREAVDYGYLSDRADEQSAIGSVLDVSYGTIVYQEQLMKLSEVVGGLEPGMRNKLQKAFSKKKADLMAEVKDAMFAGALAGRGTSGVVFSPTTLDKLWATFEGSAAYLFNASHACAYGFVSYQTAYLKANWPVQYGAALLSVTDDDDKRRAAIRSLQVEGIHILAPDINRSGVNTQPDGDAVRLGLSEVKGVGKNAGHIVAERDQNGRFVSLADAVARVQIPKDKDGKLGALPVNVAEALVEAGAFDEFGPRMGQVMIVRAVKVDDAIAPVGAEWGVLERSARQRERLGLITGEHPLATLREQIRSYSTAGQKPLSVRAVQRATDGARVMLLGVLAGWTEKAYKRGRMVTLTLEGSTESVEGVMWDEDRARLPKIPTIGDVVVLSAQVRVRLVETERIDDDGETVTDSFERRDLTVKRVATVPVSDPARVELPAAPVLVLPDGTQAAEVADAERPGPVGATASAGDLALVEPPDEDWPIADEEPDGASEPVLATVHHLPGTPVAPEVIRLPVGSHGREHPILRRAAATFELPEHFMEPAGGVWLLRTPRGRTAVVIVGDHDAPVAVDAGHPTGWSALDVAQAAAA